MGVIVTAAAFVAVAGMYLYFCWRVYALCGDVHALEVATKVGRWLGLGGRAPSHEAPDKSDKRHPDSPDEAAA